MLNKISVIKSVNNVYCNDIGDTGLPSDNRTSRVVCPLLYVERVKTIVLACDIVQSLASVT